MTVLYVYNATVQSVHDGDTLTALLDLGFSTYARWPIRLLGMNARELTQPGGKEARDYLASLCPVGAAVTVSSVDWDKFGGRIDGYVTVPGVGDLSTRMIADQYAAPWNGTGPRPIPPWPIPPKG